MTPTHNDSISWETEKRDMKKKLKSGRARRKGRKENPEGSQRGGSEDGGSGCSLRGVSSGTIDADIHTWSTNMTDYDGGASCSSSSALRTSHPSIHALDHARPTSPREEYEPHLSVG